MMRKLRELIIKALGEPDTVYLGSGVYRYMNHKGFLFFVSTQRIVPLGFQIPNINWEADKKFSKAVLEYWEKYATQHDTGTFFHAIEKQMDIVLNMKDEEEFI